MQASRSHVFRSRLGAALIVTTLLFFAGASRAAVYLSVAIAPPLLPVYEQPLIPGPGYIWTPGYWAWGPDGFYWVPGTWVLAPYVGALWTPGYWAWTGGAYWWHPGYWGRHVGFYGGVNYGFGYTGYGYHGGRWNRGVFAYNRAVNNVTNVRNVTVYNTTIVNNAPPTRVSFNGGPNGVVARPTAQDRIAERDRHTPLLPAQTRHELAAHSNRALLASVNGGNPSLAATARPQPFRATGPSATTRSFSQQALARPSAPTARSDFAGPGARPGGERGIEQRGAPPNADARQYRSGPQTPPSARSQAQIRSQEHAPRPPSQERMARPPSQPPMQGQPPMHPQGQMRAPAQGGPQGGQRRETPPQQGRSREQKEERQRQ